MDPKLQSLLAELAASELAYREYIRERMRIEDTLGRDSFEWFQHDNNNGPFRRRDEARRAMAEYSIVWAAERAQSFLAAANEVAT